MNEESDTLTGKWPPLLAFFLLLVVTGGVVDIALDRPQAVEVYRKAKLQGRSELAAFFLQDVVLPS